MAAPDSEVFTVGSLVTARDRDWIVVATDDREIIQLRPLSGRDEESVGLLRVLEGAEIERAVFADPDLTHPCDYVVGRLLTETQLA